MSSVVLLAPYLPEDRSGAPITLAPRTVPAAPVRVTIIDNGKPRTVELLTHIAEGFARRLGAIQVTAYFKGAASRVIDEHEVNEIASTTDVALTGIGDCGACSANSLADALRMESAGVPSTLVLTEPFSGHISRWAATLGVPGYPFVSVPHPVSSKAPEVLARYGASVSDLALRQITSVDS
jgi:hypothetical protein